MKAIPMADKSPVVEKTVELCQTIIDQPAYQALKQDIHDFMNNEEARSLYTQLCDQQEALHDKQHQGTLQEEDVQGFQALEQKFLALPAASKFVDAQRKMHDIEQKVSDYVRRTFELGRVPSEDELPKHGGCGSGCGCSGS